MKLVPMVAVGICLAVVGSFMFLPSAKVRRERAALAAIRKEFRAADATKFVGADRFLWLNANGKLVNPRLDQVACFIIWSPQSARPETWKEFEFMFSPAMNGIPTYILIAPSEKLRGWTMAGKAVMGQTGRSTSMGFNNTLAPGFGTSAEIGEDIYLPEWKKLSGEAKKVINSRLEENRRAATQFGSGGIYFQTGTGLYFELSPSQTVSHLLNIGGHEFLVTGRRE